jgi:hypothetical protein
MRAWLVYAGLTLPLGLLGHASFELLGGVSRRAGSITAEHAVLACVAGAAIALAVMTLRRGSLPERRARMSLLRAALPSGGRLALAGATLQAIVSAATLAAEGVWVDPTHLLFALGVGLVGVLIGALAFSAAKDSIFAFAAALIGVAGEADAAPRFELGSPALASYSSCTIRLRAGRGPPFASASAL